MNIEVLLKKIKSLSRDSSKIAKGVGIIAKYEGDYELHYHVIDKQLAILKKAVSNSHEISKAFEDLIGWIDTTERELEKIKGALIKKFAKELDSILSKEFGPLRKWGDGLTVSLFAIETFPDRMKVRLWYGPKQKRLAELDMSASIVEKSLAKLRSSLGSNQPPEQFLFALKGAYDRVNESKANNWVYLSDILPELAFILQSKKFRNTPKRENYSSYLQHDLSYDLYQLRVKGQAGNLNLRTATLAKTKSKTDSLWIPNSENIDGGEHFSEVRFKEDI